MIIYRTLILFTFFWAQCILAFKIQDTPICIVPTPNSILLNPTGYETGKVGLRMRYATCTGAAWFHGTYLATLNLYGQKLAVYKLDVQKEEFTLLQEIKQDSPVHFFHPEAIAISPDGALLAMCDNHPGTSKIHFYALDFETHLINPTEIYTLPVGAFIHNVRFTRDGNYLVYATFSPEQAVCLHKIINLNGILSLEHAYSFKNDSSLLKAKGINFTRSGSYAIIAYALSIATSVDTPCQSLITVHHFDAVAGSLGNLVCSMPGTFSFEDLTFLNDDQIIVLPDQNSDSLILYPFDPVTGQINPEYTLIKNPEAQLSFPHGVAASPDGTFLVATNYGTDTFNLYRIEKD